MRASDTVSKAPNISSDIIWYCFIVPNLLVIWASYNDLKLEVPILEHISDDDFITYSLKGGRIVNKGLADDTNSIWTSIPPVLRSLIIKMWISRPDSRNAESHPTPTIDEGDQLVDADPHLAAEEVAIAKDIIRTAVDQHGVFLFRHVKSSMD
jgi:hypothetical protein